MSDHANLKIKVTPGKYKLNIPYIQNITKFIYFLIKNYSSINHLIQEVLSILVIK